MEKKKSYFFHFWSHFSAKKEKNGVFDTVFIIIFLKQITMRPG